MKSFAVRLLLVLIAVLALGMCAAAAETNIRDQLSFVPAATWEEAKVMNLTIVHISEGPRDWNIIEYKTPTDGNVSVYYRISDGGFAWAETNVIQYCTLPDGVWGIIRYNITGKVNDVYFCQEDSRGSSLYSYYDAGMRIYELEYYYKVEGQQDRLYFYYNYYNNHWDSESQIPVEEYPFNRQAVLNSVYKPTIRIVVANPAPLQAQNVEITRIVEYGKNDHGVWLLTNFTGGMAPVSFQYQIFAMNASGEWYMTWEAPNNQTPYFWIGEDGKHYFKVKMTDGVTTAEMQTDIIVLGNDPAELVPAFVTRCYQLILNREPDAGGLADWVGQLASKTKTAAEIIVGFMYSDEFTNRHLSNADTIEILYNAMLNRPSDEAGKADWLNRMAGGAQIMDIIAGFCGSAEFQALCEEYGIEPGTVHGSDIDPSDKVQAFVVRCYQLMLNREPDAAGLEDWTKQLKARTKNASEIIYGFMYSAEYTNRNLSNDQTVEILYNAMLNRASDEGGKNDWLTRLAGGAQIVDIINGFCGSPEFTTLCAEYGIEPGHVAVGAARIITREKTAEALAPAGGESKPVVINEKIAGLINRFYQAALGREAGEAELVDWAVRISGRQVTLKQAAKAILFSDEAKAQLGSNEAFVRTLYRLYFNREADAEGFAFWTGQLNGGGSREAAADAFENADEFKAVLRELKQ